MERLYITFPDLIHTQRAVNSLLLKRVDIQHLGVIAKEGAPLGDLPQAPLSVRSDIRHSLIIGVLIGGLLGVGAGLFLHSQLNIGLTGYMILTTLIGAVFGAWAASMIGMIAPNSELLPFSADIEKGKLLLIVDVPIARVDEIKAIMGTRHPEATINTLM